MKKQMYTKQQKRCRRSYNSRFDTRMNKSNEEKQEGVIASILKMFGGK